MNKKEKKELILKRLKEDIANPPIKYMEDGSVNVGWPRSYNEIAADLEIELWKERVKGNL